MIGGLQGEFEDLDNKYLKQNISKSRSEISGSFERTLQLCMSDWVSATRGFGHVWPRKLKRRPDKILPWVEWVMSGVAIRSNSNRIPQEDTWRAPLSGLPQGEAHGTREHHNPEDSISYLDMLSGSLTKVSKPCYVIPIACHNPCSAALRWCVRTSFAMDSKELSSISDCFGDQITKKNTKLTHFD